MESYTIKLIYALKNREEEKALYLLHQKPDKIIFNYKSPCCCNIAFLALKTNQIKIFQELIPHIPDLYVKDEHHDNMLIWSAKNNKIEAINIILDEINRRDYIRRRNCEKCLSSKKQYLQLSIPSNVKVKFNNINLQLPCKQ